jgi:hypothetical protein
MYRLLSKLRNSNWKKHYNIKYITHYFCVLIGLRQYSEHDAFLALFALRRQGGTHCRLEHFAYAVFRLGAAFKISIRANVVGHLTAILAFHRLLFPLGQLSTRRYIIAQIALISYF